MENTCLSVIAKFGNLDGDGRDGFLGRDVGDNDGDVVDCDKLGWHHSS